MYLQNVVPHLECIDGVCNRVQRFSHQPRRRCSEMLIRVQKAKEMNYETVVGVQGVGEQRVLFWSEVLTFGSSASQCHEYDESLESFSASFAA